MIHQRSVLVLRAVALALAALAATAPGASAQSSPRSPVVSPPPPSDFMLGRPKGFISVDGGFLFASAGSDLYEFITDQLTVEKKNFNTPVIGGRVGVSLSPRLRSTPHSSHRWQTVTQKSSGSTTWISSADETLRRREVAQALRESRYFEDWVYEAMSKTKPSPTMNQENPLTSWGALEMPHMKV